MHRRRNPLHRSMPQIAELPQKHRHRFSLPTSAPLSDHASRFEPLEMDAFKRKDFTFEPLPTLEQRLYALFAD